MMTAISQTKTILITGACGWLGKNLTRAVTERSINLDLLRHVSRSMRIRCLILPYEDPSGLRVLSSEIEVVRGDIRNAADCATFCEGARAPCFPHGGSHSPAARAGSLCSERRRHRKSVVGGHRGGGPACSRGVVEFPVGLNPHPQHSFDESSPYSPYMNYGRSKMQMELQIKQLEAAGKIETVIVRPPWFWS
jgi:nucleoside-diphosphate-sugar epimerase